MRVGYLVSRFPSTTETFIAREMAALRRRGVEVELFALVIQEDAVLHPEARGFVPRHASLASMEVLGAQLHWLRRSPGRYLATWRRAITGNLRSPQFLLRTLVVVPTAAWYALELERLEVDHVHAHWATHTALAAWVVHQLTGRPYSITGHAHDIFVEQAMLAPKLADAQFVAVISEFNREYLQARYPEAVEGKISVVRCGVDPQAFSRTARAAGAGPVRFICVASLQDYKGHRFLVAAMQLLVEGGADVHLELVGDGELREELRGQVREAGLEGRVTFRGRMASDEVAALLESADAVVLPSVITASGKMEGIPVALMEAGAAGLPVVASRISGIPELVIDGVSGLLVEPGDAQALAQAMGTLAADPDLRVSMGAAGRRRVLEEFTVDRNADRLLSLLSGERVLLEAGHA